MHAAPPGGFGERVPVRGGEQRGGDVHLLQLCAAAEVRVDFVGEIIVRIGGEVLGKLGVDEAVEHERVEGEEWAAANDVFVGLCIAIGDPALAGSADAGEVMVFAAAPDGVGIEEPEGRGCSAGGEVDEDGGLLLPEALNEMDGGVEVAVEGAAGEDSVGVAGAVELELVDVVLIDHL